MFNISWLFIFCNLIGQNDEQFTLLSTLARV